MAKITDQIAIVVGAQSGEGTINANVQNAQVVGPEDHRTFDFVDGDVTVGTDEIAETAHGFTTGHGPVRLTTTGTLPAGLATATDYYVIRVDADTIKLATTRANALAGTAVDITGAAGGGTHTLDGQDAAGVLIRDESLTFELDREEEEPEEVPGFFSKLPGDFIRALVSSFSFDVTMRGSGQTLGPADGDHDLPTPIVHLLSGAGVLDTASDQDSTTYGIGAPAFLTFKVWRAGVSYTVQDCRVQCSLALTPKQAAVLTVTVIPGAVTKNASDPFPEHQDYGLQSSTQAPILRNAGAAIGGVTRGFLEGTLTFGPTFDEFPDSNSVDGVVQEQGGYDVQWSGPFFVDSADSDQDFDNLVRTASFPTLSFRLGAADSDPSNSLLFSLPRMDFTKLSHEEQADRVVLSLEGFATGSSGDDELTITSS